MELWREHHYAISLPLQCNEVCLQPCTCITDKFQRSLHVHSWLKLLHHVRPACAPTLLAFDMRLHAEQWNPALQGRSLVSHGPDRGAVSWSCKLKASAQKT